MSAKPPIKVSNWMQALSDFMVARPDARAYEAAAFFGVTEAWLSTVKNSDAFRRFHNERRDEHFSRISTDVGEKLQALAEVSLDELTERVEEQRQELSIQTLHDVGKMSLQALGFGGRGAAAVNVNVNQDNRSVVVHDAVALQNAREKLAETRDLNDREIVNGRLAEVKVAEG